MSVETFRKNVHVVWVGEEYNFDETHWHVDGIFSNLSDANKRVKENKECDLISYVISFKLEE